MPRPAQGAAFERRGRVVETGSGPVVRFAPGCGADGFCACAWQSRSARDLSAAALGLAAEASSGRPVTLQVDGRGLLLLAGVLFALPVAALITAAWAGGELAARAGWNPDLLAGLLGLGALGATFSMAARNGGALLRALNVRARMD